MELTPRLRLMNWLVRQGLEGLPENDLLRGFCERCRAEGLPLSRGLVVIDTLHPSFEGRGFRWNDKQTNESEVFEYGSSAEGDAAQAWRRSTFFHMLEHGHEELLIDLAECDKYNFPMANELAAKGHKHFLTFVHRFGEAGTMGEMDCVYSSWLTRHDQGFGEKGLEALRDLVPVLGLADQVGRPGRYRAHAGPGLSRPRRGRAGVARQDLARHDRAHHDGAVVFRSARLHRDQRIHRARRDHPVPQ